MYLFNSLLMHKITSILLSVYFFFPGLVDAYCKIYRREGFAGLYRGFWVSTPQIVSSLVYISSYEGMRHILATKFDMDSRLRALIAGGTSSIISQSIIVPFDVLSQHLMMLGVSSHGSNTVVIYIYLNYMVINTFYYLNSYYLLFRLPIVN